MICTTCKRDYSKIMYTVFSNGQCSECRKIGEKVHTINTLLDNLSDHLEIDDSKVRLALRPDIQLISNKHKLWSPDGS